MCVPPFFFNAVDIKQTERRIDGVNRLVWTQGTSFSFKLGDSLYNQAYSYCPSFKSRSPNSQKICFQVKSARESVPARINQPRDRGQVTFDILVERKEEDIPFIWRHLTTKTLSQDEFLRMLITGPANEDLLDEASLNAVGSISQSRT